MHHVLFNIISLYFDIYLIPSGEQFEGESKGETQLKGENL